MFKYHSDMDHCLISSSGVLKTVKEKNFLRGKTDMDLGKRWLFRLGMGP